MSVKRFATSLVFFLVLLGPFSSLCPAADDSSFGIIGDTHVGRVESVYTAFINRMEKEGIQTVVHVGDAINTPGNAEEWERLFKITGNKITLYMAPGNHDVNTRRSLAAYTKATGREPYYSVAQDDTLFLLLNTELPGQERRITGQQLSWLEKELARDFKYKFVFLHRPLFPTTARGGLRAGPVSCRTKQAPSTLCEAWCCARRGRATSTCTIDPEGRRTLRDHGWWWCTASHVHRRLWRFYALYCCKKEKWRLCF